MFSACWWDPSVHCVFSTGCLQNALSFWISVLLVLFGRGCSALLVLARQLCKEQRKKCAFLCLDSELCSDTRCVGVEVGRVGYLFYTLLFCQVFRLSRNPYFELLVPFSYCDTDLASTEFFIMSLTGSESCANLHFYFKKQIGRKFVYVK